MQIKGVADVLAGANLAEPELDVLLPNENNYRALLIQPHGRIATTVAGVHHRNPCLANSQLGEFLKVAAETQAELVIAPECSMPWATLVTAIKKGTLPDKGKLWVLGCESINCCELQAVSNEIAPFATVLHETLALEQARFTDPLAYVFLAPPAGGDGPHKVVVLVQFKTCAMGGDSQHFETNGLQKGSVIYQFGVQEKLRLISLVCSDAFEFDDNHAKSAYRQSLVIHIQLNRTPRQPDFRRYRDRLFSYAGDTTEVVCLNWARHVEEWKCDGKEDWKNIGGSAWYLRPDRFDVGDDALVVANHRRGLYYTRLQDSHLHALFFNYQPAVYEVVASKVAHIGVLAVKSYRRGPQLVRSLVWRDDTSTWVAQDTVDDGFSAVVGESGDAVEELKRIATDCPLKVERILALSTGKITSEDKWYKIDRLDSCIIDSSEVIRRLTFCQDPDVAARDFRVRRLKLCGNLWNTLKNPDNLPPALNDLKDGFHYEWSLDSPHQNVLSTKGRLATAIYMGEDSSDAQVEETEKRIRERLRRFFVDPDKRGAALDRLAIWFRTAEGVTTLFDFHHHHAFNKVTETSEFDFAREK